MEKGNVRSTTGFRTIGPLLFLVCINDLEEGVMNSVLKFAHDTISSLVL
jgi:hypothetical protein